MRIGKILSVNASEGRGFIEDENEQEIAFCLKGLNQPVHINETVMFEIELGKYGLTATNVILS